MRKTKRALKALCAFALAASIVVFASTSFYGTDIDELEQQQQELQEQSEEYKRILEETQDDISQKEEYLSALQSELENLNEQIEISRSKIDELDDQIVQAKIEIKEANYGIQGGINTLRSRIRAIYMSGDTSTLEIILGAKDFGDFLDKVQLVKTISQHDSEIISDLQEKLVDINAKKADLDAKKAELDKEQETLDTKQVEYEGLVSKNQALLSDLYEQSEHASHIINSNSSEIDDIEDEINAYYEEQERLKKEQEQANNNGGNYPEFYPSNNGGYTWPCPGFYYLSSQWNENRGSYNHGAIDIAGSGIMWSPVVAASSGTVELTSNYCSHNYGKSWSCGCGGGYGNYIIINHGGGYTTLYAHLSDLNVSVGQSVQAGQVIGYVGSTGESSGAHLHFECRYYGSKYNPMSEY
ncbi:MAG: peptidoglycan DD-metalloendopeptidase family protein [Oscillospiraceae bacterium]|jgi:murein DD-endopeptidase MepM/ murein hydrolase activator NlpD|nr:peptidoglycan DD-metalloendopeptidase family protein [Oscillospiraceae bacterium]